MPTLPPKLGHIPGCLALSDKNLGKKTPPPPHPSLFFENKIGNLFFTFLNMDQNAINFFNCNNIGLYHKAAFGLNFWELPKPENSWKHALSLSCIFQLGHFPKSKIEFKSNFLIESYIITILKNIGSALVQI